MFNHSLRVHPILTHQFLCDIDGLAQDCNNFIANALELLQSCTEPSIYKYKLVDRHQQIRHFYTIYTVVADGVSSRKFCIGILSLEWNEKKVGQDGADEQINGAEEQKVRQGSKKAEQVTFEAKNIKWARTGTGSWIIDNPPALFTDFDVDDEPVKSSVF